MITTPKSVPELLRENALSPLPPNRQPVRILVCGKHQGVESVIRYLHVLGFAEVGEWSLPLPSPVSGEVIRILTRYYCA